MSRFSILAFLAIAGVSAGPCRPSSSVTSGLETTATSTEIGQLTTTLATTSTDVSETLSVILSSTEATTTTEVPTALETTTTLPTTTAVVPDPDDCAGLSNPYTAPDGTASNIMFNNDFGRFFPIDILDAPNFQECVLRCSQDSRCTGSIYEKGTHDCFTLFSYSGGTSSSDDYHVALRVEG